MSLRVLHVVSGMDAKLGGVSQAVQTMIAGLIKKGVYNEVVCLEDPNVIIPSSAPFIIHQLGPAKGPWNYNGKLMPWLLNNLKRFDKVIIHGLWLFTSYAVRKATNKIRGEGRKNKGAIAPSFEVHIMPHGMLDPYFQKAAGRKLKAFRNLIYWKVIESKVVNEADSLLFTSNDEYLLAEKSFHPYLPKRVKVIGLGVYEPPAYTSAMADAFFQKCPAIFGKPYLLFLSRVHEKKGLDILIKAYLAISKNGAASLQQFPKIVIAGPGLESAFGKSIQQLVLTNELLKDNIHFCGMLSGDSKWGAFYKSEAFILISHQENFGIAVVESLACGKPVLISNKINIWREIDDGKAGIITNDTNEGAIEMLTNWLALTDHQKKDMGSKAAILYKKCFTIEVATNKMLEAI